MIKFFDDTDCPALNNYQRLTKPLIEKRRRARINLCLMQLKDMVIDSGKHYIQNPKCKYEKADILEQTVDYLQTIHNKRQMERDVSKESFNAGFLECLKQVEQFSKCLTLSEKLNNESQNSDRYQMLSQKLLTHLDFCRLELTHNDTVDDIDSQRVDPAMDIANTDGYYERNVLTPNSFSVIQHTRDYSSSVSSTSSSSSTKTVSPPLSPLSNRRTTGSLSRELVSDFLEMRANSVENERNSGYELGSDGVWRPW